MHIFKLVNIILWVCCIIEFTAAQVDYSWWNAAHNWDSITHWSEYIIVSPDKMGPNALPVPEIRDAAIGKDKKLAIALEAHTAEGAQTQNIFVKAYIPLVKNKVAIEFYGVPIERYKTSTAVRDERRARGFDAKGSSGGDLYVGTIIQLIRNQKFPDMTLGLSFKTASGNNFENARFIDAPGYFFDLSFGKSMVRSTDTSVIARFYGMVGFYSWQTNHDKNRQNDAFLFGLGTRFFIGSFSLSNELGGYLGYIGNGDQPIVYRLRLDKPINQFNFQLQYQLGIHDFPFQTFRFSLIYRF